MLEKTPQPAPEPPARIRGRIRGRIRKWKRPVILALLLLAGGAVVNVAVAWGIAHRVELGKTPIRPSFEKTPSQVWAVTREERFGSIYVASERIKGSNRSESQTDPRPGEILDRWTGFATPTAVYLDDGYWRERRVAEARGWPLHSMWYERVKAISGNNVPLVVERNLGAVNVSREDSIEARSLPIRPLMPGFIINTLFYALLLWLLFFAPFTARRMLRRRRGLCEKCAYPIGVSAVCTECGDPRRSRPQHPSESTKARVDGVARTEG